MSSGLSEYNVCQQNRPVLSQSHFAKNCLNKTKWKYDNKFIYTHHIKIICCD